MAKNTGNFKLSGSVGNLNFYTVDGKDYVRGMPGPSTEQFWESEQFERSRENISEFGAASADAGFLKSFFIEGYGHISRRVLQYQLAAAVRIAVNSDAVNTRGNRRFVSANMGLLKGFDFNPDAQLHRMFQAPFSVNLDRVSGLLQLTIPDYKTRSVVRAPAGATAYRLYAIAAEVDFNNRTGNKGLALGASLNTNADTAVSSTLDIALTAGTTLPVFTALGISFYRYEFGQLSLLNTKERFAMQIVGVDV